MWDVPMCVGGGWGSTIVTMKEKKISGKDWKEIHQDPQEWLCFCLT